MRGAALLDRYLLRQLALPFIGLIVILLLGLSLERLLRLIRMVVGEGAPVGRAFELLFYLVPHYLGLAVTVGVFFAVLLALRRLHERSELVIYFTAGVSLKRLMQPIAIVALVLMLAMAWLTGHAQPWSRYDFRVVQWEVKKKGVLANLKPGVFQRISRAVVIRAEEVSKDGTEMDRFFAAIGDTPGKRTIMVAEHASLHAENDDEIELALRRGQILHEMKNKPPLVVHFGEYPWKLPLSAASSYGPRGKDARELTTAELIGPRVDDDARQTRERRAELHARLVQVIALPVLAVLAVPLAMLGRGRAGRAYGLLLGLFILILFEQLLGFGKAMAGKGALPVAAGLWLPLALLALAALWFSWKSLDVRSRGKPTLAAG